MQYFDLLVNGYINDIYDHEKYIADKVRWQCSAYFEDQHLIQIGVERMQSKSLPTMISIDDEKSRNQCELFQYQSARKMHLYYWLYDKPFSEIHKHYLTTTSITEKKNYDNETQNLLRKIRRKIVNGNWGFTYDLYQKILEIPIIDGNKQDEQILKEFIENQIVKTTTEYA